MTDTKLDVSQLIDLLDTIVAEAPEGKGTTRECYYRTENVPEDYPGLSDSQGPANCIAGMVIYKLGGEDALDELQEDAILADNPAVDGPTMTDTPYGRAMNAKVVTNTKIAERFLTFEAVMVLRLAQNSQDMGETWGLAAEYARLAAE